MSLVQLPPALEVTEEPVRHGQGTAPSQSLLGFGTSCPS